MTLINCVSETRVDRLEAIEVHGQDHEQPLFGRSAPTHGLFEPVRKQRAIGQTGELIVKRIVQQLLFGSFAIRDVRLRSGDAIGTAVFVVDTQAAAEDPAKLAVLVANPILAFEMGAATLDMRGELRAYPSGVVGVKAIEPLCGLGANLGVLVAQHLLPAQRVGDCLARKTPVPDAVVGATQRQGIALLALS
jgi:hypothetical protein